MPVATLFRELREKREAIKRQTQEAARLEQEIVAAAAQESRQIVDGATEEIHRVASTARRELLVLTAQVQEVTGRRLSLDADGEAHSGTGTQVLDPAAPEIERLNAEAAALLASVTSGLPLRDFAPAGPEHPERRAETLPTVSLGGEPFHLPEAVTTARPLFEQSREAGVSFQQGPKRRTRLFGLLALVLIAGAAIVWILRSGTNVSSVDPSEAGAVARPSDLPSDVPSRAPAPTGLPAAAPAPTGSPAAAPAWLVLETVRPVWLRVQLDGQPDDGRLVEAGVRREIASGRQVAVRAGDAGAVMVQQFGGPRSPLGRDGQVLTRVFRAAPESTGAAPEEPERAATAGTNPAAIPSSPPASPAPGAVGPPDPARPPEPADAVIRRSAESWLRAYFDGNTQGMRGLDGNLPVVDDRRANAGPGGAADIGRIAVDQVRVLVVGNDAVYTARLREVPRGGAEAAAAVSFLSAVWVRDGGQWLLQNVRLVPEALRDTTPAAAVP